MHLLGFSLLIVVGGLAELCFAQLSESRINLEQNEYRLAPWGIKEKWSLSMLQSAEKQMVRESSRAEAIGSFEFSRSFDDQLQIMARPAFRFVTGREQDIFSERLPKNEVYADEFWVKWTPTSSSALQVGALNQSHLGNRLLVDDRPFPAARVGFNPRFNPAVSLAMSAQIAIPSSYTLEAQATDSEPLPKFQSASMSVDYGLDQDLNLDLGATFFAFSDLPQIVAVESDRLGNSVSSTSSATGRFNYDYEGIAVQGGVHYVLGWGQLGWRGLGIRNSGAPSDLGTGFVSTLSYKMAVTEKHILGLATSYFRIQPDTAPALYTDEIYSNNRIGLGLTAYLDHKGWGLRFKSSYVQDTPYFQDPEMGDRTLFLISVGNLSDVEAKHF